MDPFSIDFVGVGAAKAGTTWLYRCLSDHPQVCMAEPKELNYFCTRLLWPIPASNWREGEEWLRARFSRWQPEQLRGEISPSYLVDPHAPRLIHERFPEARIIISYRNPTDALYSLYFQFSRQRPVPRTFEAFIDQCGFALPLGFYHQHTLRFLDRFPRQQLHLIVYDDITSHPGSVLSDLFRFLGVASDWCPKGLERRDNVRRGPRSLVVRNTVVRLQVLLDASPRALRLAELSRRLGLHELANWIHKMNLAVLPVTPMRPQTRGRQALYAEQNLLLGELLGRDLSHWNE
jgi:hypothetical protein